MGFIKFVPLARLLSAVFFASQLVAAQSTLAPVDTADRVAVARFYQQVYMASAGVPHGWTGDAAACIAGETSQAYRDATLLRINYYRALAGLPGDVALDPEWSLKAQQAALMMSVNNAFSHFPPSTWTCYTAEGAQAAGRANIYLGRSGPEAIDGYMNDPGANNAAVGHRRWILYPPQKTMGSGSVPGAEGKWPANVLWVLGGAGTRPTGNSFVAWPSVGYFPYVHLPESERWSFSVAGAEFSGASVAMQHAGTNVPLSVYPPDLSFGDRTLVWTPLGVSRSAPQQDSTYSVRVSNVLLNGVPRAYEYQVTVFDPNVPVLSIFRNPEGALSLRWPRTSGTYLLQTSPRSGTQAEWRNSPVNPTFSDEHYTVTVRPGPTSEFYRLRRMD